MQYDPFNVNEIVAIDPDHSYSAAFSTVYDSNVDFDFCEQVYSQTVPGTNEKMVLWGYDNQLPYALISAIGNDEIMSQNKFFNVLTCYGAGLKLMDPETGFPTKDTYIRQWQLRNSLPSYMLEQATDMKYFFFTVSVIILSRDGHKINRLIHKDACYCRFEEADSSGKIGHIYFANWNLSNPKAGEIERIPLLDLYDPLGDLKARMGLEPDHKGRKMPPSKDRKFAIVTRFPTPGNQYYPIPYYTSIFKGDWFEIKKLIGRGKKTKLKNHAPVKYQVEVHRDYWMNLCEEHHVTDPAEQQKLIDQEKVNIKNFLTGIQNSGKPWITGFYTDPTGKETHMVKITLVDTQKEGGDWSEDIAEAANTICYCDNIHPNLVGATPGKTQTNNSGSDKRELFTLKQALEISFHDLMLTPINICIHYNGWQDKCEPQIPMILLTTLDEKTDAKKINPNDTNQQRTI